MTIAFRNYLLSITGACLLLTVVMAVLKEGTIRKYAAMAGGLLIILTVISPLLKIDTASAAEALWSFELRTDAVNSGIEIGSDTLLRQVITDKCNTYILDKASALGLELQVEVQLEDEADIPYPVRVVIRGNWSPAEQQKLSDDISENLGIPKKCQEWLIM